METESIEETLATVHALLLTEGMDEAANQPSVRVSRTR